MIKCEICKGEFLAITNTHLAKHGITTTEYRNDYSEVLISDESRSAKRKLDRTILLDRGLGSRPDSAIALEVGLDRRTVAYIRKQLDIPAFISAVRTQEGEPCRSIYEAMYDAYLHWKEIGHSHEVPVPGLPFVADFRIDDKFIEILGMLSFKPYHRDYRRKKLAYTKARIPVEWLRPQNIIDLYSTCPIKIRVLSEHRCSLCGQVSYDLVRGYCNSCYMRVWRKAQPQQICEQCETRFAGNNDRRYCSRECYWKSLEFKWPSWEWLEQEIDTKPVSQVARELGVKSGTLHVRLRRRRIRNNGRLT